MKRNDELSALTRFLSALALAGAGSWAACRLLPAPGPAAASVPEPAFAHGVSVQSLAFTPDGRCLAVGGGLPLSDEQVCVWDTVTRRAGAAFSAHKGQILGVAFTAGGQLLTAGFDGVKYWDPATGLLLRSDLGGPRATLTPFSALSRDGSRLATAIPYGAVRLWDLTTGQARVLRTPGSEAVCVLAFSPEGHFLAAGDARGDLWLWDSRTGEERAHVRRPPAGPPICLSLSPGAARLACGLYDGSIEVWDLTDGTLSAVARGHEAWVQCLAFSADGRRLASGGHDQTVRVWDPDTGQPLGVLGEHRDRVNVVAFAPGGGYLVSGSQDCTVRVWDLRHLGDSGPVNPRTLTVRSSPAATLFAARQPPGW